MSPLEKYILSLVHRREAKGIITNFKYIHDRGSNGYEGSFEDFVENDIEALQSLINKEFLGTVNHPNEYFPRLFLTEKAKKLFKTNEE